MRFADDFNAVKWPDPGTYAALAYFDSKLTDKY